MTKANTILILLLVVIIAFFSLQDICLAQEVGQEENSSWYIIKSKYFTILCHPDVNIRGVNNRIGIRFYDVMLNKSSFFSAKDKSHEEQLAEKFDRILYKVEKVLGMYPPQMELKVKIFKNQSQLDEEYSQIFNQPNRNRLFSFYVHKNSTIYTIERVIWQGLLAHEMGHAVVDHYFLVFPPGQVGELLAQFAEAHLED